MDSNSRNGAGEKVPRGGRGGSTGPKGAGKQDPPTKQVCYNCGKPGHFANNAGAKSRRVLVEVRRQKRRVEVLERSHLRHVRL